MEALSINHNLKSHWDTGKVSVLTAMLESVKHIKGFSFGIKSDVLAGYHRILKARFCGIVSIYQRFEA
jgi:hypothetical protein